MRLLPQGASARHFTLLESGAEERARLSALGCLTDQGDGTIVDLGQTRVADICDKPRCFRVRGGTLSLTKSLVMGILNVTPDSFSDGGRYFDTESALLHAQRMEEQGADLIDVGGESTRPGHQPLDQREEWRRVGPVLEQLVKRVHVPISVDTRHALTARRALELGVHVINDVSGLGLDADLGPVVAQAGAGYIGMVYAPLPKDEPLVEACARELLRIAERATTAGIAEDSIMLDPGFGFATLGRRNLELLRRLEDLTGLGYPLLVGMSRKGFIGTVLNAPSDERLEGSLAVAALAAFAGAAMVRVHDVAATKRVLTMVDAVVHA